jgi:hypothetical protein
MEQIENRLERLGITGYIINRNGPRFYIERVRGRVALIDSTRTSQRAYIDLADYTPHCVTHSDIQTRRWCLEKSKEVEANLFVVARYLRMIGLVADGHRPVYSHQRWVFRTLHQAGVVCHIDSKRIVLDCKEVVRHSDISVLPISIRPLMAIECDHDWSKPMKTQAEVEAQYRITEGISLRINDAGRMTMALAEATMKQLEPLIGTVTKLVTIP